MLKKLTRHPLQDEIDRIVLYLADNDPETKEYECSLDRLERLTKIRDADKIKPEAVLSAAVSVASIVLVLYFEKFDIVTSKAFGLIKKP